MKKYRHIFFDLDHTLWDFHKNSEETINELHIEFSLTNLGINNLKQFIEAYWKINDNHWEQYRKGVIKKEFLRVNRFYETFKVFKIYDYSFAERFAEAYVAICPDKTNLVSFTIDVLNYLKPRYTLHIITNGFEEAQYRKLNSTGIANYFTRIITSEKAGCQKPGRQIFNFALEQAGAFSHNSIIIGDNLEADILGGKEAGWGQVYYNPERKKHDHTITHEINCLSELKNIL